MYDTELNGEVLRMLSEAQKQNYAFFEKNLCSYLDDPILKGKYAVFFNEKLQGAYDSFEAAYNAAYANYPSGDFIIQQIVNAAEVVEFLWTAVI